MLYLPEDRVLFAGRRGEGHIRGKRDVIDGQPHTPISKMEVHSPWRQAGTLQPTTERIIISNVTNGMGALDAPTIIAMGQRPSAIVAMDFDGNDTMDLVVTNELRPVCRWWSTTALGRFPTRVTIRAKRLSEWPRLISIAMVSSILRWLMVSAAN